MTQVTIPTWQERLGDGMAVLFTEQAKAMQAEIDDLRAALQAVPAQPEPNLSSLKPDTQKAIREWIADGSFVERAIGTIREQECEIVRFEKAQPVNQVLVDALTVCRDRFFPAEQHESARDYHWKQVNEALAQVQAQPAQGLTDGGELWLWRNGDHILAFKHLYPCFTPGGDPMTLGAPFGRAVFRMSHDRAIQKGQQS